MRIDETEIFLMLEETKSLSQAAKRLYMSRPGLSQKLSSMELEYGKTLYERTSTGIVPTHAGEIVTKYAHKINQLEKALAAELAAQDEHFSSTIDVGMSLADGVELLPKLAADFHAVHPEALVHLDAGYEPELIEKVKGGRLDFAIVENQPVDADISALTLGYDYLDFLAPDAMPYTASPQPVHVNTLLEWPMIIYEWESGRHMVGNRQFRERYGISLMDHNMVARFDTHEAMVNGVKAGLGWGSVPHVIMKRYRYERGIIWLQVDTEPMRYPVDLVWRTDRDLSPLAREFRDFIAAADIGLVAEKLEQ